MTLLTESLRYWIIYKMNTDKAGVNHSSDASVPGEGEHRSWILYVDNELNLPMIPTPTREYGLDADLIMLSLATHEPHFKVLREDVFSDQKKGKGCYTCGQPGHLVVNVKVTKRKTIELNLGGLPLEIREGAIDTLLKIWKTNLARMGGYLTDCEAEERQDQASKRRKIDSDNRQVHIKSSSTNRPQPTVSNQGTPSTLNLPSKPAIPSGNLGQTAVSGIPGLGTTSLSMMSNSDVIKNRFAIRTANMDAAAMLRAELSGTLELPTSSASVDDTPKPSTETSDVTQAESPTQAESTTQSSLPPKPSLPLLRAQNPSDPQSYYARDLTSKPQRLETLRSRRIRFRKCGLPRPPVGLVEERLIQRSTSNSGASKRKADELESTDTVIGPIEDSVVLSEDEDEEEAPGDVSVFVPGEPSRPAPLKMLGNNMVEQDDTVKIRGRYFRQSSESSWTMKLKTKIVKYYVEGLAWVLAYYYQDVNLARFYPYHYSPFASDFTNLEELEISLTWDNIQAIRATDFEIDMNGEELVQGIALLPFIEQDRLLTSMKACEDNLKAEDKIRTSLTCALPDPDVTWFNLLFSTTNGCLPDISNDKSILRDFCGFSISTSSKFITKWGYLEDQLSIRSEVTRRGGFKLRVVINHGLMAFINNEEISETDRNH
ncbi:hypothetical protein KEM48_012023 [Puccinia striiformis f. sp. tritici PST-130]|nr:hypothetical protein KEM48_012023 [Puccinia striiformis f. sp. tritici PST-130]